jgi:hypothetical protein
MSIQKRSKVVAINGFISVMYNGEKCRTAAYRNYSERKKIIDNFKTLKLPVDKWYYVIEPNVEDLKRSTACKEINDML